MAELENIFDKIKEILGAIGGNFNILEYKVDVKLQMEYFDFSRNLKRDADPELIVNKAGELYDPQVPTDTKKEILALLATIETPEAFRLIETFVKNCANELKDWAIMALQESRMLLESKLLEENQVYISTGLGGKSGKLRYFIALFPEFGPFTETQQKLIKSEFEFHFKKFDAEVEKIDFQNAYASIVGLIPLDVPVKDPIQGVIDECNSLGSFIKNGFLITNVKEFSPLEVENILNNNLPDELVLQE